MPLLFTQLAKQTSDFADKNDLYSNKIKTNNQKNRMIREISISFD